VEKTELQSAQATTTITSTGSAEGQMSFKLFEGALIHGGEFHISINTLNQSPTVPTITKHTEKKWKRIKILDSD